MTAQNGIDRESIRKRPDSPPLMYQSWCKLLFMHWELPPEILRPLIPQSLQLDTFKGKAWLGVTPFVVRDLRPAFLPALPWLSDFNEVNVRTYVHCQGVPGVWFFSLDADSLLAVAGARTAYRLPYHHAEMNFKEEQDRIDYSSNRVDPASEPAQLELSWRKGPLLGKAAPGSLEFFLVERYCLYAADETGLYRARIFHEPWRLQEAELLDFRSTMVESEGLPKPTTSPLLHYSERQDTAVWPLKRVTQRPKTARLLHPLSCLSHFSLHHC
jgi:uncharacterized protein